MELSPFLSMPNRKYLKEFVIHARKLRVEKKFSQADLARRLEKDKQSIQRFESGKVNPTLLYLKDLADALDIPLKKFFDF